MTEFGKGFFFGVCCSTVVIGMINMGIILILDHLRDRKEHERIHRE
jgi:L-asparagine transporter-like permease